MRNNLILVRAVKSSLEVTQLQVRTEFKIGTTA